MGWVKRRGGRRGEVREGRRELDSRGGRRGGGEKEGREKRGWERRMGKEGREKRGREREGDSKRKPWLDRSIVHNVHNVFVLLMSVLDWDHQGQVIRESGGVDGCKRAKVSNLINISPRVQGLCTPGKAHRSSGVSPA